MLQHRMVLLFSLLIVAAVFVMATMWEFGLEDTIFAGTEIQHEGESASDKWEFVLTTTVFSLIALVVPTWLMMGAADRLNAAYQRERAARHDAEEAAQAKSLFLSSMNHELRTPLNAVIGFGQLLDSPDNPLNAEQQESLGHILDAGSRLLVMVNNVLDLETIEGGTFSLRLEPVACSMIVDSCLNTARDQAKTLGVTLDCRADPDALPLIRADVQRAQQVLLNLLSNALKYNQPGGRVTFQCDEAQNGFLRFSITDTGPGIPPDKIADLFTPFNRLGLENGPIEGAGIGLAVAQALVRKMGGRIGVDSTPGHGSTFWFTLPKA